MARIITFIATAGVALLVAAPALGKPVASDPATEAQILRGEALGRYYQGDSGQDPATEAQVLRGQALDRHFGLGRSAEQHLAVQHPDEVVVRLIRVLQEILR